MSETADIPKNNPSTIIATKATSLMPEGPFTSESPEFKRKIALEATANFFGCLDTPQEYHDMNIGSTFDEVGPTLEQAVGTLTESEDPILKGQVYRSLGKKYSRAVDMPKLERVWKVPGFENTALAETFHRAKQNRSLNWLKLT
jgi:hypothetical protein